MPGNNDFWEFGPLQNPKPPLQIDPNAQPFHADLAGGKLPLTEAHINDSSKVNLGSMFRGVEGGTNAKDALRMFKGGDIGTGVYLTLSKDLASSYGGGPKASVKAGTRTVHEYSSDDLYPEDVAYIFGGTKVGEPVNIVSGNGIKLWEGEWSSKAIEDALSGHSGIKMVIGTPNSIGRNQISVRDPSILKNQPLSPLENRLSGKPL